MIVKKKLSTEEMMPFMSPEEKNQYDPIQTSSRSYHFGFIMLQGKGLIGAYLNFRHFVEQDASVIPAWTEVMFPVPETELKSVTCGALQVRSGLRSAHYDAVLFNLQNLCLFQRRYMRRVPCIITTDATPNQFKQMGKFYNVPQPHYSPLARYRHKVNVDIYRAARLIVPASNWTKSSLMRDYGVPEEKIVVMHMGVDVEQWAPPSEGMREAFGEGTKQLPHILFVGGDFERKGGPLLLDWFLTRGQGLCELHLVTRTPPSLTALPVGLHIHTGLEANDPRLIRLYHECHVFVLPTLADSFGLASIEAMATGLPVITTNVGGVSDIVENEQQGFLIEPNDGAALASGLERLLNDAPLRRMMGKCARAKVLERFDASKNSERLISLMKTLVPASGQSD